MRRDKTTSILFVILLLCFAYIILHSLGTDYQFYIIDSLVAIGITTCCFLLYRQFHLNNLTFACIGIGLLLHTSGAFGFYARPPTPWEWDLTTHVFGIFAITLFAYNIISDLAKPEAKKSPWFFFAVIFVAMGAGIVIEFLEFGGFAMAGFEEGFLGRGPGDIQGDWISGDYWDTIVDLWYNLIGAVVGFVVGHFSCRKLS